MGRGEGKLLQLHAYGAAATKTTQPLGVRIGAAKTEKGRS